MVGGRGAEMREATLASRVVILRVPGRRSERANDRSGKRVG